MKRQIRLILAAMMAWSSASAPAFADVSARYEDQRENSPIKMVMSIETNDAGDVRFQMAGQASYLLMLDGVTYLVSRSATGISVARFEDIAIVMGEVAGRMGVNFSANRIPSETMPKPPELVPMGEQQVNSRSGIAYGIAGEDGKARYALVIVSQDPKLAPLGAVMARSFDGSMRLADKMMPGFSGIVGENNPMGEIFRKGALLSYMHLSLTDVSFDEIPEGRFKLPAAPMSIEQIREQYRDFEAPPTLPIRN